MTQFWAKADAAERRKRRILKTAGGFAAGFVGMSVFQLGLWFLYCALVE